MKIGYRVLPVLFGSLFGTATMAGPITGVWTGWTQFQYGGESENDTDGGSVGPGFGGQKFDAEYLYYKIDDQIIYLGLQTGFDILDGNYHHTDNKWYYTGDLALSFDGYADITSPVDSTTYEYGIDFGLQSKNFSDVKVDMGSGTGIDPAGLYKNVVWNTGVYSGYHISDPFALDTGTLAHNLLLNQTGSDTTGEANGNGSDRSYYRKVAFDISGLGLTPGYHDVDVHWTMSCGNDNINGRFKVKVPEPAGVVLMGLGLLGLAATGLRRRNSLRLPS